MSLAPNRSQPPKRDLAGISFEIADLVFLQGWAAASELLMVIELDHYVDDCEYEEVVALYDKKGNFRQWHLWRAPDQRIILQPLIGRAKCFTSVADAIEAMTQRRSLDWAQ
jgi:hypothetical protein